MDKRSESDLKLEILAEKREKLKKEFSEQKKLYFFDTVIDCGSVILPAHRFVLCFQSKFLAQQLSLSPDVNELNWTDYGANIGIELLRWIYTNKVDFNNVVLPGLPGSSHQSTTLFEACELLLSSVNEGTDEETIMKYHHIGKIVGADRLVAKCLELKPKCFFNSVVKSQQVKVNHQANTNLYGCGIHMEVDTEIEQRINDLAEEVEKFEKISIGCRTFGTFSDIKFWSDLGGCFVWPAHKHYLGNRITDIRDDVSDIVPSLYGVAKMEPMSAFLRWLYTDLLELENVDIAFYMLNRSSEYKLPSLLDRCDEAALKLVDITSCARFHDIAIHTGATKILKCCKELIKSYGEVLLSEVSLKMDVDFGNSSENSICEKESCELLLVGATGLLDLNDDCLFHVFRYLSLVDLGSIKDTCKRMSELADQSFKLRKDKSITIRRSSMLADIWNLAHFGKLMTSLTVKHIYEELVSYNEIFQMIAKYSNEQLKAFAVGLHGVAYESLPCLEKVLNNVETIDLFTSGMTNGRQIDLLLGYCNNLRDVYIYVNEVPVKTLWCSKNVNITCLTLRSLDDDQILVEICEHLTHLECFEFFSSKFSSNNISRLSQLDHLKRLKIGCCRLGQRIGNIFQKFAVKNHLEYLCLSGMGIYEELAHMLRHFQNLKELVFERVYYNYEGNAKNILSKSLDNVEKLAFVNFEGENDGWDEEFYDFEDIIEIVENLTNLKELSVTGEYLNFISKNSYLRLRKKRNLDIFLKDPTYKRSIDWIANDLSNYVRLRARPQDFFDNLCSLRIMV